MSAGRFLMTVTMVMVLTPGLKAQVAEAIAIGSSILGAKSEDSVSDMGTHKALSATNASLAEQALTLSRQKSILESTYSLVSKLNTTLTRLNYVRTTVSSVSSLTDMAIATTRNISRCPSLRLVSMLSGQMASISSATGQLIQMTNTVISEDLRMTDAERLERLGRIRKEADEERERMMMINRICRESLSLSSMMGTLSR